MSQRRHTIKQKSLVPWTKNDTLELLQILRNYPLLYDTSHPGYTLTSIQANAFEQISDELKIYKPDVTPDIVRNKVKELKSQYDRDTEMKQEYLRKRKKTDGPYKPRLWCFDMMKFFERDSVREMSINPTVSLDSSVSSIDSAPFDGRNPKKADRRSALNAKCLQLISDLSSTFAAIKEEREKEAEKSRSEAPQTFLGMMIESELSKVTEEIYDEAKWKIINILEEASKKNCASKSVLIQPEVPLVPHIPKPDRPVASRQLTLGKGVRLVMIKGTGTKNSTITMNK